MRAILPFRKLHCACSTMSVRPIPPDTMCSRIWTLHFSSSGSEVWHVNTHKPNSTWSDLNITRTWWLDAQTALTGIRLERFEIWQHKVSSILVRNSPMIVLARCLLGQVLPHLIYLFNEHRSRTNANSWRAFIRSNLQMHFHGRPRWAAINKRHWVTITKAFSSGSPVPGRSSAISSSSSLLSAVLCYL